MSLVEILFLLLAVSIALNIAIIAGMIACSAGVRTANAFLTGGGAAATFLALYFAAYH